MSNLSSPPRAMLRRSAALLATTLVVASVALGGAMSAQAASATLTSSSSTVTEEGLLTLTADGLTPGDGLTFVLDGATPLPTAPLDGGAESADANGTYVGEASIPLGLGLGVHTVEVTGAGGSALASTTVTVVPRPTSSVGSPSISLSDYLAGGVPVSFTGFAPGASVSLFVFNAATGDLVGPDAVAGPDGVVSFVYIPQPDSTYAVVDRYALIAAASDLSIVSEPASFEVTADAAPSGIAPVTAPAATPVKRAATFTG